MGTANAARLWDAANAARLRCYTRVLYKLLGSWVLGTAIILLDCGMLLRLLDY